MKRCFLLIILCAAWATSAWGHSDIEGLPDAVAIMSYKQILYLNPDDLEARNKLAMALYRTNKIEEAEKELEYVLKKDPNNFNALDGYGVVLIRAKKYKDAMQYLDKALRVNDKDVMVHVHVSVAYEKMNMRDQATAAWKKAQSLASPEERKQLRNEWKIVSGQ